ncbi:MAG: hypothetical protein L0154_11575, partial [Chloroflexi bacterium]|nr:hypothetical protein [Chloroflexota bacterium]
MPDVEKVASRVPSGEMTTSSMKTNGRSIVYNALCEIGLTKKNCLPRWEVSKPTNLGGQFNDKY